MPIYEFEGRRPEIGERSYVHPEAVLIGAVKVGPGCLVCAGAVLRADFAQISLGPGSNIQDNCVIHAGLGPGAFIEDNVIVGHGAILHDVTLKSGAYIGMGAVLLPGVIVETEAMVGAGAVVSSGFVVPSRKIAMGNPAKIRKDISPSMVEEIKSGLIGYQELTEKYRRSARRIDV